MKTHPNSRRPAGRIFGIGVLLLAMALTGCVTGVPIAPHPTVVYVPHPHRVDASLDFETLNEMYAVSPDVDPDGLGPLDWIWDQSFIRLTPWAIEEKRQELARVAYARTEQQQREKVIALSDIFQDHVAFEGVLIGDFAEPLDPTAYGPEGIYMIDDLGEKMFPSIVEPLDPVLARVSFGVREFGSAQRSFPRIVFQVPTLKRTRSLSLYIATPERRIRFTWVFDPAYTPSGSRVGDSPRRWRTD